MSKFQLYVKNDDGTFRAIGKTVDAPVDEAKLSAELSKKQDVLTTSNSLGKINNTTLFYGSSIKVNVDFLDVSSTYTAFSSITESATGLRAYAITESATTDSKFSHGSSSDWFVMSLNTPQKRREVAFGSSSQIRVRAYVEADSSLAGSTSGWTDWKDIAFTDDITSYCQSYVKSYVDGLDFLSGSWDDLKNSQTLNSNSAWRPGHVNIESDTTSTSSCYLYLGKLATTTAYYPKTAMACIRIHGWWGGKSSSSTSAYYKNVVDATVSVYKSSATSASAYTIAGICHRYEAAANDIIMTSDGSFYLKSYTANTGHTCHIEIDYPLNVFIPADNGQAWTTTSYSGTSICSSLIDLPKSTNSSSINSVSTTSGRTYQIQKSSTGTLVVNVPWSASSTVPYISSRSYVNVGSISATSMTRQTSYTLSGGTYGTVYVIRGQETAQNGGLAVTATTTWYTDYDNIAYVTGDNGYWGAAWLSITVFVPAGKTYYLWGMRMQTVYMLYTSISTKSA